MDSELLKPQIDVHGRPMRVLSVIPGEAEGAAFIFCKRHVAALEKWGIVNQSYFLRSRTSPHQLFQAWLELRQEISTFRPDLVHAHYGTVTAFFCALSTRLPLVVTYRGSELFLDPALSLPRNMTGRLMSQIAALRADGIICVSPNLARRLWWKKNEVAIIPSGVDTRIFTPRPRGEARKALGWGEDERVVIFNVGDDPLRKRLDLAEAAIERASKLCGAINFVKLDGYRDASTIPSLLNGADCLLVTSDWEGSPNIVKEALACNLPVVSVDVGDVCDLLAGVEPSYLVRRDPEEIGLAVARILRRPTRSNGSQKVGGLALDVVTRRVIAVYQKALKQNN